MIEGKYFDWNERVSEKVVGSVWIYFLPGMIPRGEVRGAVSPSVVVFPVPSSRLCDNSVLAG